MATKLLSIFYQGHFTQMVYPEKVQEQLDKWGLPLEAIDVIEYPEEIKTPFEIGENFEISLLTKLNPPQEPRITSLTAFNEFKKTPLGKKFLEAIAFNSKALLENNLPLIPFELMENDIEEPTYFTSGKKITPIPYMKKGKILRDFKTGKEVLK